MKTLNPITIKYCFNILNTVLIIFAYSLNLNAQNAWIQQNPQLQNASNLRSVYFSSATNGIIVGGDATSHQQIIIKTSDGGTSWQQITTITTGELYAVHFPSALIGFAAGYNGLILKTTDGGLTWNQQTSGTSEKLNDVKFYDNNTGYAIGNNGAILKTANSGSTWNLYNSGNLFLGSISIISSTNVYISGKMSNADIRGMIIKTTNAGSTWDCAYCPLYASDIYNIFFINDLIGFFLQTEGGDIYKCWKTTDGGTTWTMVLNSYSYPLGSLTKIYFVNSNIGYISGGSTGLYYTSDGGNTWQQKNTSVENGNPNFHNDVFFVDQSTGYIVGGNRLIMKTTDGGNTWFEPFGTTNDLNAVFCTDENNGWTCGNNGVIMKTTNGGSLWTAIPSNTMKDLFSVNFFSNTNGIIVGDSGLILKTTNAGSSWSNIQSGTNQRLYSVFFLDNFTGFCVGINGTILMTIDGGNSWMPQISNTNGHLSSVFFIDGNVGYICGGWFHDLSTYEPYFLKSTDGGITWLNLSNNFSDDILKSIFFISNDIGFTVSNKYTGNIYKTSDGGNTWTATTLNAYNYDIKFVDNSVGYIASGANTYPVTAQILKTNNCGNSWSTLSPGTTGQLNSLYFINQNTGWAVGENGTVIKTTTGGVAAATINNSIPNDTVCNGSNTFFGITTSGIQPIIYQWQVNMGSGWSNITNNTDYLGATTDTLYIQNIPAVFSNYKYRCYVTNSAGSNISNAATLYVSIPAAEAGNNQTICAGNTANLVASGGSSYHWSNGINNSANSVNPTVTIKYFVTVTDSYSCSAIDSVTVNVNQLPQLYLAGDTTICLNSSSYLTVSGATNYTWYPSNGLSSTTGSSVIANPVNTTNYLITGTDGNGCQNSIAFYLQVFKPYSNEQICLVTVDSASSKNRINWNKTYNKGTALYKIYKEISTSNYNSIGTVPFNNTPEYIDFTSNPDVSQNRYKISVIDTCNNESYLSPYHQTINLSVAQGSPSTTMVLLWSEYIDESGTFMPDYYYIFKGSSTDNLFVFDSVPGTTTLYNDVNVFYMYYYQIGIHKNCGQNNISNSNLKDNSSFVNINNIENSNSIKFYPNPANNEIIIEILQNKQINGITCEICNTDGQIIRKLYFINQETKIDIKDLNSGFYIIKVKSDNGVAIKKMVKQ